MVRWKLGDIVTDKFYHAGVQGSIISIKDNTLWVRFGDKNFRYSVDTTSLVRV